MVRYGSLSLALYVALAASPRTARSEVSESRRAENRPNVVWIVADDLGWADLHCYGSPLYRTPHVDRLAAEGMRFTQFYAACPVCSPTRAALLTGQYPARLHLTDWLPGRSDRPAQKLNRPAFHPHLPLTETTLAEVLKAAGYTCASIGKWHLGGAGFEPEKQGFDLNIAGDAAGTPLSYFAPYQKNGRTLPGLEQAPAGEYLTDRLTAEAEQFIEQNRARPFFLYLPHFAVHTPLTAKADLIAKYPPAAGKPRGVQDNPIYAAMIESLDESVGRILKKLAETGLSERTVVCFTSDNGGLATVEGANTPATSNAPLREGKGYLYEGGIRVPLIVKWPGGVKPGSTSATPACSIDLFPTVLEICGVKSPAAVDGVSLVPLLKEAGLLGRDALYWHYPHYSNQGGRPGSAIRAGEYKLIEYHEDGRRELFRVEKDPGESANLVEKLPEVARELAAKLNAWRQAVGAQAMQPNPEYVPNPQASDGTIRLPASTADVHGVMLRFEPLPHKNTLGYWVRPEDWASWDFEVTQPGTFRLEALQGCGNGSGGSEVDFTIGEQVVKMTVVETGGFQAFVPREIGTVRLDKPGRYTLTVKPQTKPGPAVMDIRQVTLTPVEKK
jgi:arylsulfatase A-like enzyme